MFVKGSQIWFWGHVRAYKVSVWSRLCFYQTRSAWSMDQGSSRKRSAVHNFAPTVMKFCVMWEGLSLPHDTKFSNCRGEIVDRRMIFIWSLIQSTQSTLRYLRFITPSVTRKGLWNPRSSISPSGKLSICENIEIVWITFIFDKWRHPLKFHTKYLIHAFKDVYIIQVWKYKNS